jgi:adenosylcobyric acid synthase
VLPYLDLSMVPAEDVLEWDAPRRAAHRADVAVDIAVMRLPRIANLDEFQALAGEPGVRVRFVGDASEIGTPDLIVIPGTKSTLDDLAWLRERGLAGVILANRAGGVPILGVCGGFQMLGARIIDERGVESLGDAAGLGLLPATTTFAREKVTRRVGARAAAATALWDPVEDSALGEARLDAYEIHMGHTTRIAGDASACATPFAVGDMDVPDGLVSSDGGVIGTYLHGLFENAVLRRAMIRRLASRKGVDLPAVDELGSVDDAIDRLANAVRDNVDMDAVAGLVGLSVGAAR